MTLTKPGMGESVDARLTVKNGGVVLLLEDQVALSPGDMHGLEIMTLDPEELEDLARWMYGVTVQLIALATGNSEQTVRKWCRELGVPKHGRDYRPGPGDVRRILERMQPTSGRPPPWKRSPTRSFTQSLPRPSVPHGARRLGSGRGSPPTSLTPITRRSSSGME